MEHEAVLDAILVGEIDAESDQARRVLDHCERCRVSLADLRQVMTGLEAADREQRDDVAAAAHVPPPVGADQVEATLRRLSSRRERTRGVLALAAAVLLAASAWVFRDRGTEAVGPTQPPLMLGVEAPVLTPHLDGDGLLVELTWDDPDEPGCWFELSIVDPATGTMIDAVEPPGTSWRPTPDERSRLPRRVACQLAILSDAMPTPALSQPVEVSLRSP